MHTQEGPLTEEEARYADSLATYTEANNDQNTHSRIAARYVLEGDTWGMHHHARQAAAAERRIRELFAKAAR